MFLSVFFRVESLSPSILGKGNVALHGRIDTFWGLRRLVGARVRHGRSCTQSAGFCGNWAAWLLWCRAGAPRGQNGLRSEAQLGISKE